MILFFENVANVFRVDTSRLGLTKLKNDMEISWRAKLAWVIERLLHAVQVSGAADANQSARVQFGKGDRTD